MNGKWARRANYETVADTSSFLVIRDVGPWDQYPTVTNDADAVVAELAPQLNGRRLLYYDSEDDLMELLVKDGKFHGFLNPNYYLRGVPEP